jgi:uncharacterized protein involved in exopolysaccharide biosynthesis
MAFDIASALEKNFIDARYDAEISVINDAITILQQHADEEKDRFDQARNEFESIEPKSKGAKPSTTTTTPRANRTSTSSTPSTPAVDPELLRSLEETRGSIQQLESARAARVAEVNQQLSGALLTYKAEHPTVVALKQKLAEAQAEPGEVTRLRAQERGLIDKVAVTTSPLASIIPKGSSTPSATTLAALSATSPLILEEDPAVTVARMKLQQAAQKYADLETRIDGAKIELDIAKTAHKYRFNIVRPAEVSRRASKPNPVALVIGLLALVLAVSFGGTVLRERRRGKLIERWQVERGLQLPIVAELDA